MVKFSCLHIVYGCLRAVKAELESFNHMVCKAENIYCLTIYRKSLLTTDLYTKVWLYLLYLYWQFFILTI